MCDVLRVHSPSSMAVVSDFSSLVKAYSNALFLTTILLLLATPYGINKLQVHDLNPVPADKTDHILSASSPAVCSKRE